ncbi:MAG: recombinase family protein [Betaproteobacteria bacterium]|nr:recombinase family protein [Betaproteobacteria bacterium]
MPAKGKKVATRVEHALLYTRVSTQMQAHDGLSLDAQERELRRAAELAGFSSMELVKEAGRSGKSISGRPALRDALDRLDAGSATAMFVTRVDRLARSTQDFLSIIDRANKNDWRIVLLDLNLDTSTYQGRFVVTIMSALAEMERNIIAERQRDVHKDRRAQGKRWGIDLGPKPEVADEVRDRILRERAAGLSFHEIARRLNAEKVESSRGKQWYAMTVKNVVEQVRRSGLAGPEEPTLSD